MSLHSPFYFIVAQLGMILHTLKMRLQSLCLVCQIVTQLLKNKPGVCKAGNPSTQEDEAVGLFKVRGRPVPCSKTPSSKETNMSVCYPNIYLSHSECLQLASVTISLHLKYAIRHFLRPLLSTMTPPVSLLQCLPSILISESLRLTSVSLQAYFGLGFFLVGQTQGA